MPDTPKFYLTTPIYYVNARPHIGHAYSTIAADVIARRQRLLGDDTFFLTGTDEHGQKVQRSAEKAGIPPQQFADEVSATFENLWKRMGITNDDYIRTTDERHKRGVQKLWKLLEERGAIYLSSYTGQYSVGEEMFVEGPPGTIGPDGKPTETVTEENYFFKLSEYQLPLLNLIESGELHIQPETTRNEVLSFLRGSAPPPAVILSGAKDPCISPEAGQVPPDPTIAYSAAGTPYVPGALKDLSISRTTFDWGIKVPGNDKHVVYVWLDALANYITAIGYGSDDPADQAKFEKYWPADIHLVGKEITRFHCVYWPAFLMAAGLPLPKSVVANGWLLFEDSKMSKSRGNVVRTETILDAFGPLCPPVPTEANDSASGTDVGSRGLQPPESTPKEEGALAPGLIAPTKAQQDLFAADVIRYFLLREIPFGQDGSFSFDALITRYNADLANGYGNLVSRTLNLVQQNFGGSIPEATQPWFFPDTWNIPAYENVSGTKGEVPDIGTDLVLRDIGDRLPYSIDQYFQYPGVAQPILPTLMDHIGLVDRYISLRKPWALAKDTGDLAPKQLAEVLYTAAESIRIITALLYPVMPYATASVWRQLGLGDIEDAARNGELKNLQWGGLKPGTKLGPLAPIFPRADKGLAQIMTDMENPAPPVPETTHAAAPPRSITAGEENPGLHVGGSSALTTERPAPPLSAEAAAAEPAAPATPTITIDDFVKIDLRVAQIVIAERIPKADKLLRLEVDLGYERRQILSGIAEFYTPEELIGKRIAVIANLAPRKMRGLESHGMLLAASGEDHSSKPILATFSDEVPLGSRIR
jgi:methionyl-tRNA synthetase